MMKKILAGVLAGLLPLPVLAAPPGPDVSITLGNRHASVIPNRVGCVHTGGGNIDVVQPSPDTVVITMSGVAVATAHPIKDSLASHTFDLEQCFEVSFDNPKVKKAKLYVEGQVIGLLRGGSCGKSGADYSKACVVIAPNSCPGLTLCVHPESVGSCENLSINNHEGPQSIPVVAGNLTLTQTFCIAASHSRGLGKASSAEFADGALDPLWISYKEPFKGAAKKSFGFVVTVRVAPDDGPEEPVKQVEPAPAPTKVGGL